MHKAKGAAATPPKRLVRPYLGSFFPTDERHQCYIPVAASPENPYQSYHYALTVGSARPLPPFNTKFSGKTLCIIFFQAKMHQFFLVAKTQISAKIPISGPRATEIGEKTEKHN